MMPRCRALLCGRGIALARCWRLRYRCLSRAVAVTATILFAAVAIVEDGDPPDHHPEKAEAGAGGLAGRSSGECCFYRLHVFLHGFSGPAIPDLSCRHGGERAGEGVHQLADRNACGEASRLQPSSACPLCSWNESPAWFLGRMLMEDCSR